MGLRHHREEVGEESYSCLLKLPLKSVSQQEKTKFH